MKTRANSHEIEPKANETHIEKLKNGLRIRNKKRIAIVDDEPDIRNILSLVVRKAGHDVMISASSGQEIVDYLFNENPAREVDIVLMDYSMPGMNGMETSKIIANRKPQTKIIFVTAADIRREAEEAGFAFVTKPFSITKLLDIIER